MCSIAIGMPLRCNRRTSQTSFNPKGTNHRQILHAFGGVGKWFALI